MISTFHDRDGRLYLLCWDESDKTWLVFLVGKVEYVAGDITGGYVEGDR